MNGTPAHSDCGPSQLDRRILCPGSRNAERDLPERPSSYAAEGTVFHEVASLCLEFGLEPDNFLDLEFEADGYTFTFDESFARHLRPGLDRVREMLVDCEFFGFETRVDISSFTEPGQFGTTDVWGINAAKRIIRIHDWKYGEGVGVEAEENWQAIAYAAGIWDEFGWKVLGNDDDVTVEIILDQMRRPDGGGRWTTTMKAINETYLPTIQAAIQATSDPNAPRHAGLKQCFFCRAKGRCAELARFNMEQAAMKFDELDAFDPIKDAVYGEDIDHEITPPEIRDLTPLERARVILNMPLWNVWMKAIHEQTLQEAMQGFPTPGIKAVPGRAGHRIWVKELVAEHELKRLLGDRAYAKKLVSPAQAEKLLGTDDLADIEILWTQRDTKPSLVREDDERKPIESFVSKFSNLDGE